MHIGRINNWTIQSTEQWWECNLIWLLCSFHFCHYHWIHSGHC